MSNELDMLNKGFILSQKRDSLYEEYTKIHSPYFRINWLVGIIIFAIIMKITNTVIDLIPQTDNDFIITTIAIAYIIYAIVIIILLMLANYIQSTIKAKKNSQRVIQIEKKEQQLFFEMQNLGIPKQYSHTYAIEKLINYLSIGRADNLKEAFNLYESELRHDQQMQQLNELHIQHQKQLNELNQIKKIGVLNLMKK